MPSSSEQRLTPSSFIVTRSSTSSSSSSRRTPLSPAGAERERLETADADHRRAARDAFQDVGAAHEAAVDDDLRLAADRGDDLRQQVDRAARVVELPSAVVRHVDHVDAVLERERCVLGGLNALDHQRHFERAAELVDELPVGTSAVTLAGALPAERTAGNRLPRVNVPLAAAERRHVDGHAKRLAARIGCALRRVDDPTVVAVGVELEHPVVAGGGRDLVEPRPRHAAHEQQAAERLRRARERQRPVGMDLGEAR